MASKEEKLQLSIEDQFIMQLADKIAWISKELEASEKKRRDENQYYENKIRHLEDCLEYINKGWTFKPIKEEK